MFIKNNYTYKMANGKRRKSLLETYFLIVVTIVLSFSLVFVVSASVYIKTHVGNKYNKELQMEKGLGVVRAENKEANKQGLFSSVTETPSKTNFLVVGVDNNGLLTDSIMVFGYDNDNNKISVVSIPRDTYVKLSKSKVETLQNKGSAVPASGIMKINAINVYGGKEYGMKYLKQQVEEILGISIHYYAVVDLTGFQHIVDTIGGVWFEVPEAGLHYIDPTQNLKININGGYQLLDGKNAEGLVRFRSGYASQDLMRMEVQQQFFKELMKQLIKKETLINNASGLISDFISYVDTDFSISDAAKYISCINKIDTDNIFSTTLPGEVGYIDGGSYFIHDKELTKKMVLEFFYSIYNETDEDIEEGKTSEFLKDYKTPIVNYRQSYKGGGTVQDINKADNTDKTLPGFEPQKAGTDATESAVTETYEPEADISETMETEISGTEEIGTDVSEPETIEDGGTKEEGVEKESIIEEPVEEPAVQGIGLPYDAESVEDTAAADAANAPEENTQETNGESGAGEINETEPFQESEYVPAN